MAETTWVYRGHEVVIDEASDPPQVRIDGQQIQVSRLAPDLYATLLIPHRNFPSLESLAQAVIDSTPQFSGRRDLQ